MFCELHGIRDNKKLNNTCIVFMELIFSTIYNVGGWIMEPCFVSY
jgi:hypothetical protein